MLEYHKINSVYMRDPATKHKSFIEGAWAQPAFEYLTAAEWTWTEKIDGTNMRVEYLNGNVHFGGRTSAAQIPAFLVDKMLELFPAEKLANQFKDAKYAVTLFGEGYGAKIQKGGGNYKPDGVDFILFDVAFGGMFAERHVVEQIASEMGLDVVPIVGRGTLPEAMEYTKAGFNSTFGDFQAEGLVMRPSVELLDKHGHRIITKVKCRDFTREQS